MKAPFGRIGGKSKIANLIIKMFPKDYKIYIEPFIGAGNVLFRIPTPQSGVMPTEIVNDLDKDIYHIFKILKSHGKWVNENINRNLTLGQFEKNKDKNDPLSKLENLKSSFFNRGKSFIERKPSKTNYAVYQDRLRDVIIKNKSFEKIIKKYDSKDSFFYLDPPYEIAEEGGYYKYHVTPEEIYNSIKNLKGKFLLSYNDSKHIRDIFKDFNIKKIKTYYTSSKKEKIELLISNY